MNASPTRAGGMWRTIEYTLACGCEILPAKTFINRKTDYCFYAPTMNVFMFVRKSAKESKQKHFLTDFSQESLTCFNTN